MHGSQFHQSPVKLGQAGGILTHEYLGCGQACLTLHHRLMVGDFGLEPKRPLGHLILNQARIANFASLPQTKTAPDFSEAAH